MQFPFSRTFFQQQSMFSYSIFYLSLPLGKDWPSYASTLTRHYPSSIHQQLGLAKFYDALSVRQRKSMIHMTCLAKRPLVDVGSHAKQRRGNPTATFARNPLWDPRNDADVSIFKHTNFTHLATMSIQSDDLVLQTTTQLCSYVMDSRHHYHFTDLYQGELEHRRVKRFYPRVSKSIRHSTCV